jgi:dihydrodipicolinate synthase/N-acetylneuraminate lyase
MAVRAELAAFEDLRQVNDSAYNVPAVKAAMNLLGLCSTDVREPLLELGDGAHALVRDCVQAWGTKPLVEAAAAR